MWFACGTRGGTPSFRRGTPPATSKGHLHRRGVQWVTLARKSFMVGSRLLLSAAGTFADRMYKNGRPENGNWLGLWTQQEKHHTFQKQQEAFFNCSCEHSKVKRTNGIPIFMASEASFPVLPPSLSLGGGGEAGSSRLVCSAQLPVPSSLSRKVRPL